MTVSLSNFCQLSQHCCHSLLFVLTSLLNPPRALLFTRCFSFNLQLLCLSCFLSSHLLHSAGFLLASNLHSVSSTSRCIVACTLWEGVLGGISPSVLLHAGTCWTADDCLLHETTVYCCLYSAVLLALTVL